jgi:hypothetical protein
MSELKSESPTIKLEKNSRGYNWEIKVLGDDEEAIKKISKLDSEMAKKWGSEVII